MVRHMRQSDLRKVANEEASKVADRAEDFYEQSRAALEEAYHRARDVLGHAADAGGRAARSTGAAARNVDGGSVAIVVGMAAVGFALGWYCRDRR